MAITRQRVENGRLLLFLVVIMIAVALVVSSFAGALLWAALAALVRLLFQRLPDGAGFDSLSARRHKSRAVGNSAGIPI